MIKILVPIDFHEASFSAYAYAVQLASDIKAEVTVIHVISGTFTVGEPIGFDPMKGAKSYAEEQLEYFLKEHPKQKGIELPDVPVTSLVRFGIPSFTVSDYAHDHNFDLICMGTRDKHTFLDRMLGSTSGLTIQMGQIPTLLIHANTPYQKIEKIIFGFADRGDLEDAVERFKIVNSMIKAHTTFVHVKTSDSKPLEQVDTIVENLMEDEDPPFSFEIKTIEGKDPSVMVRDYCIFQKADMLAMVHRERGILSTLFRPSRSIILAQSFHLPTMVFPEDDD